MAWFMWVNLLVRSSQPKDIDHNKIMDDKAVVKELNDTEAIQNEVGFFMSCLISWAKNLFVESAQVNSWIHT